MKREFLCKAIPIFLVLLLVFLSGWIWVDRGYLLASIGIALCTLWLFWMTLEKQFLGSFRLVLTAILTALCVVCRFLPILKPMTAMIILSGKSLGKETGFLVGAMSALLSNFYFGQGPWTPFQMLAWGLIGWSSGVLAKPLEKRGLLLLHGMLCGVAFSFLMDIWTVLWYNGEWNLSLYLMALFTAIPFTLLYAVSNVIFLALLEKSIEKKLNRILRKYGELQIE